MKFSQEIVNEYARKYFPKNLSLDFIGSSSDLFVGRFNYPNVFVGLLAPPEHNENAFNSSMPEYWFSKRLSREEILMLRSSLIHSRFKSNINNVKLKESKLLNTAQEISMSKKSTDVEFILKKQPKLVVKVDSYTPPIGNPAPLKKAIPQENIKVDSRVDYLVSDSDLKSEEAILDLYKHRINISYLIRILSAGLLGLKIERKLVPTRWSTTAVDSMVSNRLIENIKDYSQINEFQVFYDEYLGNHYEILLIPKEYSFEVIEIDLSNLQKSWQDYETYFGRKKYACSVTGAYYANRLSCLEYLERIKKQASILVLREIKPAYNIPLGVGILREVTRNALTKNPLNFNSLKEALDNIKERLRIDLNFFTKRSKLLKELIEQRKLNYFI